MESTLQSYLKPISAAIQAGDIEQAIEGLLLLDEKFALKMADEVTVQSAAWNQNQRERDFLAADDFRRFNARVNAALTDIVKRIPKKAERNAAISQLMNIQANDPTGGMRLEKIIGGSSNLLKINWLDKALKAAKAVCRIVREDGEVGTGWLVPGGFLMTNNHVLPSKELATTASAEFNFEVDMFGQTKNVASYKFDTSSFWTSADLDCTRIKVVDRPDLPLAQWGALEIDAEAVPVKGEPVTIIQHPKGEDKQIALNANEILGQQNIHLYYSADTEGGSSGSPVFNKNWKVIAIHHAGGKYTLAGSGIPVDANRGILFKHIKPQLK